MASTALTVGSPPQAQSTDNDGQTDNTPLSAARAPKALHSTSCPNRRHSLPHHFLPPNLWSANTSSASLVETEEAAQGEHVLDEATVAHRISALHQLNGSTQGSSRHRYAKSTGARNSTFNQPVIVRTYSGRPRPRSHRREPIADTKTNRWSRSSTGISELKLPSIEAFSFKGIMDEIKHGVAEDLERIAEICARSRYSLSNQYEVHMPPHGRGEQYIQTVTTSTGSSANTVGPTLQAIGSDDEHTTRSVGKGSRGSRRTRSAAYGTLETIMSSSRSSDDDKSKKEPAAALAEEVRGRAAKKGTANPEHTAEEGIHARPGPAQPSKHAQHVRSKSATFASIIIDSAQGFKHDTGSLGSPSLISEPARPQTSIAVNLDRVSDFDHAISSPALQALMLPKPTIIRNETSASSLVPDRRRKPSMVDSISSWIPWWREGIPMRADHQTRTRSTSHAEANLRGLLEAASADGVKGKGKTIYSVGTH